MNVCKIHNCEKTAVKDKSSASGFRFRCNSCRKESNKKYRKTRNAKQRALYNKNSDKIKKYYSTRMNKNIVRWRAESIRHTMQKTTRAFDAEYFSIDLIEKEISNGFCPICKVKFKYEPGSRNNKNPDVPTADRFDSNIGYTIENTNFICWNCNRIKRCSSVCELENVVKFLKIVISSSTMGEDVRNSIKRLKQENGDTTSGQTV